MNPLRVAFCTKANSPGRFERDTRNMGQFSYAVPEFTWEHVAVHKWRYVDRTELARQGYDLIFHEDGAWARYRGDGPPVVYYIFDSTLSEECHYAPRLDHAKQADLVLVDHDRLERFAEAGAPVRRLSYCVNDKLYRDYGLGKDADVVSHMNVGGPCGEGRIKLGKYLGRWCELRGYSYRGGTLGNPHYARSMSQGRIVANWPRYPANRSHRVFDAMACRSCLITGRLPEVSGEVRVVGRDYAEVDTFEEFFAETERLLDGGAWQEMAENGYKLVQERHTWAVRAKELRQILNEELGL